MALDAEECDTCYVDESGNRWWNWCAVHVECRDEGCTEPAPCPTCGRGSKPDIKDLLERRLREALHERCANPDHVVVDDPDGCAWCDPLWGSMVAYARARGAEMREARA